MANDEPAEPVLRLVLVEDQAVDRAAFRQRLEGVAGLSRATNERWQVVDFADPDDAIRYLDAPPPSARPDILVCDLDFSGCQEGIRLVEHASNLANPVPCIVLSQGTDREVRSECLLAGALSYINKMDFENISDDVLRETIADVLCLSRARFRFRQVSDWEHVHRGSVTLGHDLLRALDENYAKIDLLASDATHEVRTRVATELRDGHNFARTIVQDFTDAPHIIAQSTSADLFCVRALVDRVISSNTSYWRRRYRKVAISIDVQGPAECMCLCNETRVRRALVNIIDNAVKFSPGAAVIAIEISEYQGEGGALFWAISVVDNGPGVPDDQLTTISTPLVRLKHTSHLPGSGFGLHSCVDLMRPYSAALGGEPNPRFRNAHGSGLEVTTFIPKGRRAGD